MHTKTEIKERVVKYIANRDLRIVGEDFERPWGGFFLIHEDDTSKFLEQFFCHETGLVLSAGQKISPKFLVVMPGMRLSWQYHDRRAELHRVIRGPVAYSLSDTDEQSESITYQADALITIPQGMRHRLIGLDTWGVVAEIWQHTNSGNPSDEADNHRVQDDFKRT